MYRPENDAKTPNGLPCWIPGTVLAETIRNQARGTFQRDVAEQLISEGFIIEYKPTGSQLRGRAKSYQSKYNRSISNLMGRIENNLPGTLEIVKGPVGPKGAFGYRLVI